MALAPSEAYQEKSVPVPNSSAVGRNGIPLSRSAEEGKLMGDGLNALETV